MFGREESQEQRVRVPVTTSKRDKYRQQIRKNNLRARFEEIRSKLIEQEQIASLQDTLEGLREQYSECNFQEALAILAGNCESVVFNQQVASLKLEGVLINLLLQHRGEITLPQASQVVSALNYLTYYCNSSIIQLTENVDFIDYLRETMQQLDMRSEESVVFLSHIVVFLMNTTSELLPEYNCYLAESDISKVINHQLVKTIEAARHSSESYRAEVHKTREYCLRLYANIVNSIDNNGQLPARVVGDVLRDEEYMLNHPEKTFILLSEAMKNHLFWPAFMEDSDCYNFCASICYTIDRIQSRCFTQEFINNKDNCLTKQETAQFYAFILFMNELFNEKEEYEISWCRMVQNVLNGFMLAQFLIEAHQRRDASHTVHALRLFVNLSRTLEVTGEQLIIVRPADDPLELVKIFTDISLLKGQKTGPACLQILGALVKKDPNYLPAVMEFRVLELLMELFETMQDCESIMIRAIELCIDLLIYERELKEEKRVAALMETKGIVTAVQKFSDNQNTVLYRCAEMFAEAFSKK